MAQITNRVGNSPLTKQQVDKNFENLDRYKLTKNTNSVIIPAGTTLQRDISANVGRLRFNTDTQEFEGFYNTGWGAVGARGYTGSGGPVVIGYTGSVGARGITGDIGNLGGKGYTGSSPVGDTGNTGATGPQTTGLRGLTGPPGTNGSPGAQGPNGDPGDVPSTILYHSTPSSKVKNNNALTLWTTSTTPGYYNINTGVAFNPDGGVFMSRHYYDTNGMLYAGASTAGEIIRYTYGGDNSNFCVTTILNNSGWLTYTTPQGGAQMYTNDAYSDYRLKNILSVNPNNLNILKNIKLYNFNYIGEYVRKFGFIAHQLQECWPIAVTGKKDDPDTIQNVDLLALSGLLFSAVKELDNKLNNILVKLNEKYGYNI